ncbi:MAG: hypothetical protein H6834_11710 [Planctomycetes bacterium]|nr:hypothetical protein [Planctomycetota bacterium]
MAVLFGFSSLLLFSPSSAPDDSPQSSTGSVETLIRCLREQQAPAGVHLPAYYWDRHRFIDQCAVETAADDPLLNIWMGLDSRTKRDVILLINELNDSSWAYFLVGNILLSGVEPDDWILCKLVESFLWLDPNLPEVCRIVGQTLIASGVSPMVHAKVVDLLL